MKFFGSGGARTVRWPRRPPKTSPRLVRNPNANHTEGRTHTHFAAGVRNTLYMPNPSIVAQIMSTTHSFHNKPIIECAGTYFPDWTFWNGEPIIAMSMWSSRSPRKRSARSMAAILARWEPSGQRDRHTCSEQALTFSPQENGFPHGRWAHRDFTTAIESSNSFQSRRINRPRRAIPIRDCKLLIDPVIFFVVLLACRVFSCRHGLADGLSDFFIVWFG